MEINPLTIGTTFWFEERKHHVVAVCKDGDNLIYVLKYFGIHKRWWHYEVMEHWRLELKLDYHLVKDIKRKRITKKELTKHDNY